MSDGIIRKKEIFNGVEIETIYRETGKKKPSLEERPDLASFSFCPPLNRRTYVAEPGILCEQDLPVKMRDGVTIYADIYRPVNETDIPCIVSWGPFGKRPGDIPSDWQAMGVPPGTCSRMGKFESADPGYWCRQGYAVANVDPRGVGNSEGDINMFGTQDGRDGYDFIEWVATQHWCNGKVTLFGNSGVAMVQWRIAAEQPPHLCCIAPWEGTGDFYRESVFEGGIPQIFGDSILNALAGKSYADDYIAMMNEHPFMNAYWEDKIPQWEKIKVPAYVTACWNHFHLRGSIEGFKKIRSTKKWLRCHREFEWPDTYSPVNLQDLKLFYDRYCRDVRNGWELTPKIRLEVMDVHDYDFQSGRPEREWPLARTQYKKLYLDAGKGAMHAEPVAVESKISYESGSEFVIFDIKFNEDTEITGHMKLRLWVEAQGHDDMDLFVQIRKLDGKGDWLPVHVLGQNHPGSWGRMRVSRRALDEKLSTPYVPVQAHTRDEKLKPGEIVPVDIEIWPTSWIWHKGQQLRVLVSGHYMNEEWWLPVVYLTDNKGKHVIHCGGKYDSYLQIPVIPPRFQSDEYIYR